MPEFREGMAIENNPRKKNLDQIMDAWVNSASEDDLAALEKFLAERSVKPFKPESH